MHDEIRKALYDVLEGYGFFEEDFAVELERPRDSSHGDLTTNAALILAKRLKRKPRELAGEIAAKLSLDKDSVASLEIAGPGFINFRFSLTYLHRGLQTVLEAGSEFGSSDAGEGERVNLEFISANPTGPLNIVSARAAAVGSSLARTMAKAGYRPHCEFYVNDAGRQVQLLGKSLRARFAQAVGHDDVEMPEDGYQGSYLADLAQELADGVPLRPLARGGRGKIVGELPDIVGTPKEWLELPEEESGKAFGVVALHAMLRRQREACRAFGVSFDTWFLESELHMKKLLDSTLERLTKKGHVFEEDGAVWFRSTSFGDEKDRVLVKAGGDPTYFLADIAYHANKQSRGFERAIDFWGPDHHGYITRLAAAMQAMGYDDDWLEIVILQQVNLLVDGKPLEMSKRAGRLVTMEELVQEVGADAAKFFFLARKNTSHMDFDLTLAKAESNDNPAWYVKYAHARICSVFRNAETQGVEVDTWTGEDLARLEDESELTLLRLLPRLEQSVARAAASREMSRLTNFAMDIAAAYHQFYQACTILGEDAQLTRARLALCRGCQIVLANTLELIGIDAPERM